MDPELRDELVAREDWTKATKGEARSNVYREFLEELLLTNRVKALVATSAGTRQNEARIADSGKAARISLINPQKAAKITIRFIIQSHQRLSIEWT